MRTLQAITSRSWHSRAQILMGSSFCIFSCSACVSKRVVFSSNIKFSERVSSEVNQGRLLDVCVVSEKSTMRESASTHKRGVETRDGERSPVEQIDGSELSGAALEASVRLL